MLDLKKIGEIAISEISYQFLRIWDWSAGITRDEAKKSQYFNIYPQTYASLYGVKEALLAANDRATKTQDKLTTLTQLQGGVLAVASIFISNKSGLSFILILLGILSTLIGMIVVLNALKVTTCTVPSYENLIDGESNNEKSEFIEYITESNQRSDFQADSNKAASSLIIFAMILFVLAVICEKVNINKYKSVIKSTASIAFRNSPEKTPFPSINMHLLKCPQRIYPYSCSDTTCYLRVTEDLFYVSFPSKSINERTNLTMPFHRDLPVVSTDPSAR